MCSCNVKIGSKSDVIPGKVAGIPLKGVMKSDFFTLLAWANCINPQKVKDAFKAKAGLDITENDFPRLVKAHVAGADIAVHNVSFLDIVKGISFTQAERNKPSCEVILTRP